MLDTYRTFGCENSQPTYRYSLLDGVKEGYLINPTVVDARTEITTELLSEEGFVVSFTDDAGEDQQEAFKQREFEKRFFADATNPAFSTRDFRTVPQKYRTLIPEYVKDYVSLNQFV